MARQPHRVQPFRPFAMGKRPRHPTSVIDERTKIYSGLSPLNQANRVPIVGDATILWNDVYTDPIPSNLTELYRITLKTAQPVTISIFVDGSPNRRFGYNNSQYAEILPRPNPQINSRGGRIIIEWGHGAYRCWTMADMATGCISLPNASNVKVSGWKHSSGTLHVGVTGQIGYFDPEAHLYWSCVVATDVVAQYVKMLPQCSKEVTFTYQSPGAGDQAIASIGDSIDDFHTQFFEAPVAGNPRANPISAINMPVGAATYVRLETLAIAAGVSRLAAIVKVKP